MEDVIKCVCENVGPKWVQLYSRLGLDYRGRYKISADYDSMAPERAKHRQCALDTVRKWQREQAEKGTSEEETLLKLLTCFQCVKGMDELAMELAVKHGVELTGKASTSRSQVTMPSTDQSTSDEASTSKMSKSREALVLQSIIEDYNWLWTQTVNMSDKHHKFAILDICQRMKSNSFEQFCMALQLDKDTVCLIKDRENITEEQYYSAFCIALDSHPDSFTFDKVKDALLACSRTDLITLIINRIRSI